MATSLVFKIRGMDCAEKVAVLKREVGPVVGGEDRLTFDILNGRMTVMTGPADLSPGIVVQAVAKAGLSAEIWQEGRTAPSQKPLWQRHGRTILTGASGLLGGLAFVVHAWLAGWVS